MRAASGIWGVVLALWPGLAVPQEDVVAQAVEAIPKTVVTAVRRDPEQFRADALELIFSRGSGGAITAAEAERALAIDRASLRARALRPLLESDLDGDGRIAQDEALARASGLAFSARGRLLMAQMQADTDADGTVDASELQAYGVAMAAAGISARDEAAIRMILALDLDADGRVTAAEVGEAVLRLTSTE